MGKITLDTMQANEKALRASYRRSLETDPLKNNSQRFKREAFPTKTCRRDILLCRRELERK